MIRVRLVTSNDPISWGIRAAEMGFLFSHSEVIMPDGTYLGAHADGGVQARPAGYDAAYKPIETIVELPSTDEQADVAHAFLRDQLGKPYDMAAIAALAGREAWPSEQAILAEMAAPWRMPEAWFCSELVIAALEAAGIFPTIPIAPRRVTPRDLYFALSGLTPIGPPISALRPQSPEMTARPV